MLDNDLNDRNKAKAIYNRKFDTDTIKTFISQLNDLVNG